MAEVLLLRLPPQGSSLASWIVCNAAGELVEPTREGELREVAALIARRRLVVLVPGADVLQTEAMLPARGGARVLQALPYVLEEQLADDVENLHFAPGARAESGTAVVHVVARSTIERWLASLAAAGLHPDAMYSDAGLMPVNPGQLVVFIDGDEAHLARPDGRRFSVPADDLAGTLPSLAADGDATPGLLVYATQSDWARHSRSVEAVRAAGTGLKVQLLPQGPLPWLAQQLGTTAVPSLLQGKFAQHRAAGIDWPRWRLAVALVGALLVAHGGTQLWRYTQQSRAEQAATSALTDALRPLFPNDPSPRDARRRVQRELTRVRAGSADSFLPAVDALANARRSAPGVTIASLAYGADGLDVRVRASNPQGLEQLRNALQGSGWDAQSQGGSSEGNVFNGRLRVRAAGPPR